MEKKFQYTRLLVKDFKACFKFYRDVMGFKPTFGTEEDVYADFDTGAVTLALFDRKIMSAAIGTAELPFDPTGQDKFCLVFTVARVDAAWDELKQKGAQPIAAPADRPDWGMRSAYFRDPDGNLIEIFQSLGQS